MSRSLRSMSGLLLLILFLGTGSAYALPSDHGRGVERSPGTWVAIWTWVASLLEVDGTFLGLFETAGGNGGGLPLPPRPGTETDGGSFIDPNGNS